VLNPTFVVGSRVNCSSWPKDFGSPSALELQIYAGTRDPLVNARAGAAVRAVRTIVLNCMVLGLFV
jgi:hypothetical protein